jgi:uncharacterized membrane protein
MEAGTSFDRMVLFRGAVIAISLTLLVSDLKPPEGIAAAQLDRALLDDLPSSSPMP